ncbi:MAG TPA: alpha/beta fold hydrolase [Rhizomicrobium sp.]|nr:alpha/beta fold hydrolase [Rhizomicrobium sp.]
MDGNLRSDIMTLKHDAQTDFLELSGGHRLAYKRLAGRQPTIVWLSGFKSDMTGRKATHLADWAHCNGKAFVAFDYFGHGKSSGEFQDGTIARWREDTLRVIDEIAQGPLVLVGSSMGAWLAVLAAQARSERVAAMVLIAPAVDFITRLLVPALSDEAREAIESTGRWQRPSAYGDGPYPITKRLLEDGQRWSLLDGPIVFEGPVRILQGLQDPDIPWQHAIAVAQALTAKDVQIVLIKNGDHRLSRNPDLEAIAERVAEVSAMPASYV